MSETTSVLSGTQDEGDPPPPSRPVDLTGIYLVHEGSETGSYWVLERHNYSLRVVPTPPHLKTRLNVPYCLVDRFGHISALFTDHDPPEFELNGVRYYLQGVGEGGARIGFVEGWK